MDYIHSTFAPRLTDAVTGAAVCDPSGRRADARSRRRAIADTVGASRRATPLARLRGSAARQASDEGVGINSVQDDNWCDVVD